MFCQSCGAQVTGAFCTKCGAPAGAPPPPSLPPQYAQPLPPAAKSGAGLKILFVVLAIVGLFFGGAALLWYVATPFLASMIGLAAVLGVSQFVFVQWVAPFLSEFPEFVTTTYWARGRGKAGMALMNMASSNITQWTVLAAMIPMAYSLAMGHPTPVPLHEHRIELLLTLLQGTLGVVILANFDFAAYEALGLLALWVAQFSHPALRAPICWVYGAWLAIAAMIVLFGLMKGIRRHYDNVKAELDVGASDRPVLPTRNHAVVLVSRVHLPTLRALAYARATGPSRIEALTVDVDSADTARLKEEWLSRDLKVPLTILDSPYREIGRPVIDYIQRLRRETPRDVVTVFIPEYVLGHWWEQLLHNQSALRLKTRLRFTPGVMVTSVPWQLRSSHAADLVSR